MWHFSYFGNELVNDLVILLLRLDIRQTFERRHVGIKQLVDQEDDGLDEETDAGMDGMFEDPAP